MPSQAEEPQPNHVDVMLRQVVSPGVGFPCVCASSRSHCWCIHAIGMVHRKRRHQTVCWRVHICQAPLALSQPRGQLLPANVTCTIPTRRVIFSPPLRAQRPAVAPRGLGAEVGWRPLLLLSDLPMTFASHWPRVRLAAFSNERLLVEKFHKVPCWPRSNTVQLAIPSME